MKVTVIIILIILLFLGSYWYLNSPSSEYATIKQGVSLDSRINCTYRINTTLWCRKNVFDVGMIEKTFYAHRVKKSDIEKTKQEQLRKIAPYKERVEKAIKEYNCEDAK